MVEVAAAIKLAGALGGVVSGGGVIVDEPLEHPLKTSAQHAANGAIRLYFCATSLAIPLFIGNPI
ncbi:MAG: hypothetical protein WCE50_18115 [Candidatus Acidiferrum sp.]